jgi:hypothetical protein
MMNEHTPGPWKQNGPEIYAPEAYRHGSQFYDIAHSVNYMDDEGTANAHLIAAAPELLEACKTAAELIERLPELPNHEGWGCRILAQCKAAIAKATG